MKYLKEVSVKMMTKPQLKLIEACKESSTKCIAQIRFNRKNLLTAGEFGKYLVERILKWRL